MTDLSPELKPCPFCGQSGPSKVGFWPDLAGLNERPRCVCGASMNGGITPEQQAAAWNHRTTSDLSPEIVERVARAIAAARFGDEILNRTIAPEFLEGLRVQARAAIDAYRAALKTKGSQHG